MGRAGCSATPPFETAYSAIGAQLEMMDSRAARLEAALRAEDALIVGAQMEVERYLTKQFEASELVDRLIRILDGPEQREAQRLAREALGEDFGNNA